MISPSQRPLPDNTQHSQQTNIHAPGGIRTHDRNRRAAVDLSLRPRGYWDRLYCDTWSLEILTYTNIHFRSVNHHSINRIRKIHFIDVTTLEQPHWYSILSHKYNFTVFKSVLFQVNEATTLTWLAPESDGVEALCCCCSEFLRPDLLKKDFQPSGDLLLEVPLRFLLDPGSSITVWYLAGRFAGPPPAEHQICKNWIEW